MASTSPHPGPIGRLLRESLAAKLFALFLLVALLPLAISDWISSTAVAQIADTLSLDHRARSTRQVSRQVLDRLLAGKTLLTATQSLADHGPTEGAPRGLGKVFSHLLRVPARGAPAADEAALLALWQGAAPDAATHPRVRERDFEGAETELRIHSLPGAAARVLIGASRRGALEWIAEYDPAYLWAPVADAGEDGEWAVADVAGAVLTQRTGGDYRPVVDHGVGGTVESRVQLFLGGEFGVADWVFAQRYERPQVLWHGQRLAAWLALFGFATLLVSTLLGRWQIVRALRPLRRLTERTRLLVAGEPGTRVVVERHDEVGALGAAFNDMAGRIDAQFDSIRALAEIDRAILAGLPLAELAHKTLAQLAASYPGATAAVFRRDPARGIVRLQLERQGSADVLVSTPIRSLGAAQLADFDGLHDDACAAAPRVSSAPHATPWRTFAEPPAGNLSTLALLPLRQQGRTDALIAIRFASGAPIGHAGLETARELRDRFNVAMATRTREEELVYRAAHDDLTGLLNRYGLNDSLDALLAAPAATVRLAVLLIDLDHFKDVNDSRGHDAGDALLRAVSRRLVAAVPPGTLVARQGGDEFALVALVDDIGAARCLAAGVVGALGAPVEIDGNACALGASIGVALYPEHGHDRDELFRCADVAMYAAKAAGRGRHAEFTVALDRAANERVRLVADLRRALERDEFIVHYQPRLRASDGRIVSAEALVRWQHPGRGLVFPDAFIAQAEASGLIEGIGVRVLGAACAQLAAWRRAGLALERVSVNVSPQQLVSGRLVGQVRAALAESGAPPEALELEVTESLLVGDVASASAQLAELRGLGVTIALDDFGTGYSSISLLHALPIDVMKIDRSFVHRLGKDASAIAVVRAIASLARSLGLHLVAEGVETEAQAEALRTLRCDELQGYLYSKPVAPAAFAALPGLRLPAARRTA
jgi:diguanylate cyclase